MTTLAEAGGALVPGPPLWRSRGLVSLFTASTTARLANESARVAMVLLVLERTHSPALAGAVVAASTLPSLVTGPLLGAWLDKTSHRRTAFAGNQLLLLVALAGLLPATGHAPSYVIVLLGLLAGLTTPVLTGGFTGLIAPLVPALMLRRAYGAEAASFNVAGVAGPALAGAITAAFGATWAIGVTAVLSVAALVAVLRVPMPPPVVDASAPRLLRTVVIGLRHLAGTPPLRAVTVTTTLSMGGLGALPVAFPLLAEDLGVHASASGYLFSTFAIGALVGSVTVASRSPRTGPMRLAFLGVAGLAVAFAAAAVAPTLPVALVCIFIAGALEGPVLASTLTVRELHSPDWMRTQVVTTAASLKFGAYAAGSGLAGWLVSAHGARAGLLMVAAFQVVGIALGLLTRSTRTAGATKEPADRRTASRR
ncbi:MAG: major facilitator superfamily 1 [Frankiales bacterium]|nr:major facilitator superfamily 1 [Frankiales bacterium]